MQTLIPQPVTATARPNGRWGRVLGFGLTARALLLLLAGILLSIPAFFHAHRIWMMVAWDAAVLALIAFDAARLPAPGKIAVTGDSFIRRRWAFPPRLSTRCCSNRTRGWRCA